MENDIEQAKAQVQYLLDGLGHLDTSNLQVGSEGGAEQANRVAEQFVDGCIVLLRRFGPALIRAAEDSALLDVLDEQVGSNPGVDLVVPQAVIDAALAADDTAPLRLIVANLAAMQDSAQAAEQ